MFIPNGPKLIITKHGISTTILDQGRQVSLPTLSPGSSPQQFSFLLSDVMRSSNQNGGQSLDQNLPWNT